MIVTNDHHCCQEEVFVLEFVVHTLRHLDPHMAAWERLIVVAEGTQRNSIVDAQSISLHAAGLNAAIYRASTRARHEFKITEGRQNIP